MGVPQLTESWDKKQILKIRDDQECRYFDLIEDAGEKYLADVNNPERKNSPVELRKKIEPWLTALFQSEHLSLLTGSGISTAAHVLATGSPGAGMDPADFSVFNEQIVEASNEMAKKSGRGEANIEDRIRAVSQLLDGLRIYALADVKDGTQLKEDIEKLNNSTF